MSEQQLPLFELATEPLNEVEDLPSVPRGFISWAELEEQWGYEPEQFEEDHDGAMSPVEEMHEDGSPEQLMHDL